jgi:hypothetical protein
MPTLASELRNKLERVVIEARDAAEVGARDALEAMAVHHHEPYPHMKPDRRELRNHLRARARQLGDRQDRSGRLAIDHLVGECAYEHWHRMLFARFLAENGLLIEPQENMAISLAEAEELAKEDGVDVWVFASRCAQGMLPQIFRPDDPLLQVSFATEHRIKLEKLLASLSQATFTASDALGWVYQFWQSKKKDEVNRSEAKIGADEIAAVTQLFTEPYMVEFLLHNTLGAWWAGKRLAAGDAASAKTEDELRRKLALPGVGWEYLRFVHGMDGKGGPWRPAAGTFEGWPKAAKDIKVLDPCCGSGHFLVAALHHLVPIRMAEEGLSAREAIDAVLRDNLHGLEIDERCCQIAAFALAFAAWTYPDAGGYRTLPDLHIACTGIGPQTTQEQWLTLAEQSGTPMPTVGREAVKNGLLNLHRLFSQAPTLGSLINPANLPSDLITADYETIQPYLAAILAAEKADDETRERAIAAAGMVKAAELLAGEYTLVVTNVPYVGLKKQCSPLQAFCEAYAPVAKHNLATVLLTRCVEFCHVGGTTAIVGPQNWLFLKSYLALREHLLRDIEWSCLARLGSGSFQTPMWDMNILLSVLSRAIPTDGYMIPGIDVSASNEPEEKAQALRQATIVIANQLVQRNNPDARVILEPLGAHALLEKYAISMRGIVAGDLDKWIRVFWEVYLLAARWRPLQSTVNETSYFSGREQIIDWSTQGTGMLRPGTKNRAYGKIGIAVSRMGNINVTLYTGELYDQNCATIVPFDSRQLPALWAFCSDRDFETALRKLDQKLNITNATLIKVPFDLAHWQKVGAEKYPDGLPDPESDDPTQWLFHGRPEDSTAPLHVAVARLLGYRWLAELDDKMRLNQRARALVKRCNELAKFADNDGIVCIPSVRGEEPAGERLLALLTACRIKPDKVRELAGGDNLDDWLRKGFFEEHCKLFHDRPFVWHIWDGRKRDGFHALVNYHKLCEGGGKGRRLLESLTYSYLGEWITRQKDGVKHGEDGAEDRLAAAIELQKRLEAILEGEPPFDLFVRWKPLHEQPIGWDPDINDGVRLNIRPFLASELPNGRFGAGILRWKPNIKWDKDRGKELHRPKSDFPWFWGWIGKVDFMGGAEFTGDRFNDCHYTIAAKRKAHETAKKGDK